LKTQFDALKAKHKMIGEVRGKGLMIGIELVRDQQKTPANTEGNKISVFCLENGLLVGLGGVFGNVVRIQPPAVITQAQMEQMVKILDQSLQKVV
jgi:4-aminobutyrate aminotransferase-like enzyme